MQTLALTVSDEHWLYTAPEEVSSLRDISTPGHGSFPPRRLLNKSLRQVYNGPVRHRGTAADQRKSM